MARSAWRTSALSKGSMFLSTRTPPTGLEGGGATRRRDWAAADHDFAALSSGWGWVETAPFEARRRRCRNLAFAMFAAQSRHMAILSSLATEMIPLCKKPFQPASCPKGWTIGGLRPDPPGAAMMARRVPAHPGSAARFHFGDDAVSFRRRGRSWACAPRSRRRLRRWRPEAPRDRASHYRP